MRKRIISLLMVLCLSMSIIAVPVKADAGKYEGVITALRSVEPFKEDFGFAGVDFSKIEIGDEIKVYNYENGTFIESKIAFPLFYDDELISVLYNVGEGHYQPIPGLHTLIDEVECTNVAIVYDQTGCHVYDGSSFTQIIQSESEVEFRDILTEDIVVGQNELEVTDLSVRYDLDYTSNVTTYGINPRNDHPDEYVYLNVGYVTQNPYNYLCWAASVAAIANYKKQTSYSAEDIVERKYGSIIDTPLTAQYVADELKKDCPEYNFLNDWPRSDRIILNLQNNNPVYIKFEHAGGYHAGVVYGYNSNGNYYILDPQVGPVLGYIDSNGYLTYYVANAKSMAVPFRGILVN